MTNECGIIFTSYLLIFWTTFVCAVRWCKGATRCKGKRRFLWAEGRETGLEGRNVQRLNAPWMLWNIANASGLLQITPPRTTGALHRWKRMAHWKGSEARCAAPFSSLHMMDEWMEGGMKRRSSALLSAWGTGSHQGPPVGTANGGNGW